MFFYTLYLYFVLCTVCVAGKVMSVSCEIPEDYLLPHWSR